MRSSKLIHIVRCHAAGEVGDVITGGVATPPGSTLWDKRSWIAKDQTLRNFVLNEPRGGVFRHINLLVPPISPEAAMGWIIMEPRHTPPMSGSNSICVATVLLETGIIPMQEPITQFKLEAPGGLVQIRATCENGKATSIEVTNHPSFATRLDVPLEITGMGTLHVDLAYGGDSFVLVDAAPLGFAIKPDEAHDLTVLGMQIRKAATEQYGFNHPQHPDWKHISFCQFTGALKRQGKILTSRTTVAIEPGKLDRSPTGTGCSARMAVMYAKGQMQLDERYLATSIIDSQFICHISGTTQVGHIPAIVPHIKGQAFITGTAQLMLDPADPYPEGYRLADTWPNLI